MAGRCNASQDAQDAWDAGDASLASGRNADGSDAGSVFADVMLNAKNIHTKRPSKKLSPKLYGPFKVLEKKGSRAYKLEISPRCKIHPVFHVSL